MAQIIMKKNSSKCVRAGWVGILAKELAQHKLVYIMAIPLILYYIIFHYGPMIGLVMAFNDFRPAKGILGSKWVGLMHFQNFMSSTYFFRLIKNTFLISATDLIFGFPIPIIFALLLNEIKNKVYKKITQSITYLPHFVSLVVICGMIVNFSDSNGIVNHVIAFFGGERSSLLSRPDLFRTIYVSTNIWQHFGWSSIIYLAALTNIDPTFYEAAVIDGASRFKQVIHITIPGIAPTIIVLLILRMGHMMSVGWEKIILLYNPLTYETADVISSFVYRRGLVDFDYSYSTAVGLFNSVINFLFLVASNQLSKKVSETSLW